MSDVTSISDLEPGITLRIPLTQVSRAIREIDRSTEAIQRATSVGARLFAADLISQSIESQNVAIQHRQSSRWEDSYTYARMSALQAEQASEISLQARDMLAEAVLTDRYGNVESRKTDELVWNDRDLHDMLIERERVRTLSNSLAEITFRNESKFRLDANTNVEILTMRVDLLNNEEETSVSLVEGDVYALLKGGGTRKKFDVEVSGIETDIQSNNFWASLADDGARFANYDANTLSVTSGGETVTLGENQGTVVRGRERPRAPSELLAPPTLVGPLDDHVIYSENVAFSWTAIPNAIRYWVEIALDFEFSQRVLSNWNVDESRLHLQNLEDGRYYWRVAGVDELGFPGRKSLMRKVIVRNDTQAPYLVWLQPHPGVIVRTDRISLTGETEAGASIAINGDSVSVKADGSFDTVLTLGEGENEFSLEAKDAAGHTTKLTRTIVYEQDRPVNIIYDPAVPRVDQKHFLSRHQVFTLRGQAQAGNRVVVLDDKGVTAARTYADATGRFRVNLPIDRIEQVYSIQVVSRSGYVTEDRIHITYDDEPPGMLLDEPVPAVVSNPRISLSGDIGDGVRLSLNDVDVPLSGGRFQTDVILESGLNAVTLIAEDQAGNKTIAAWRIWLDREPPSILQHTLSTQRAEGGDTIEIRVFVSDTSSLRKSAAFELKVGETVFRGHLAFQGPMGYYRGLIQLPQSASGSVRLTNIEIEDIFNQIQRYAR